MNPQLTLNSPTHHPPTHHTNHQSFVVVSDPEVARHVLRGNAENYSKGILAEILDFVMGTGLIPADGEVWRVRRRAIVPALHKAYISAMVAMFSDSARHGAAALDAAAGEPKGVEMESFFSRLALDIIGKVRGRGGFREGL